MSIYNRNIPGIITITANGGGGILLGVIIYHTQSIWGGPVVHLGIAWLMEAAGYWL
ncbi:MAG: hypothetical protein JNL51_12895 [Chitinophagaceae bacterium]|nr:hypothetical protein [Chitinophagaceae bacterium]